MTVPDFPDEQAPDAHARAISLTGAPPLVLKNILDLLLSTTLPALGTITRPASGLFTVNQPAYEILISLATSGTPAPVVSVELQWVESFTGFTLDSETYYLYSGDANGHLIHGRGPSKADRVKVIFKNYSGAVSTGINYVLLQTSRTFTREFWKTITKGGVQPVYPGLIAAASNASANVLSDDSHLLAANATISVILPFYTGTVRLFGTTTDTTVGNSRWFITPNSDQIAGSLATLEAANGEQGFAPLGPLSMYAPTLALPRSQCTLLLSNTNATTSQTITAMVTAQEDRS